MEYPKINSLWKRQGWYFEDGKKNSPEYQAGRQSFIIGDYAEPEFGNIKKWRVDEKIDGTNVRIVFSRAQSGGQTLFDGWSTGVTYLGRTENAQMPTHLLAYLQSTLTKECIGKAFPEATDVILFGEGYGPKIQAGGGNYRSDAGFILFDVFVGGWWLKWEDVTEIAHKLGIPHSPHLGIMTEEEIVEFVKSKPLSRCSVIPQMMEGVIARADPLVLFRNGKPVKWKLKCKEFT